MNLKEEIKKRFKEENENFEAIGAEIKRRRLALSKTLQAIADEDCSPSYVCKIERNQVKPNPKYLREICKRVNISEDKMEYLLYSKDLLIEAVKIYYFKDSKAIDDYKNKLVGLDNYRTELIRFIFALASNNIIEATSQVNKLWKLVSSLQNIDLMLFCGFFGVYKYLCKDYLEASEYLNLALDFNIEVRYFNITILEYLFRSCYKTGSRSIYKYYKKLEEEKLKYGENLNLDEIHYLYAIYYLEEGNDKDYEKVKVKLANPNLNYNLEALYKLIFVEDSNDINVFNLNDYVKMYYILKTNPHILLDEVDKTNLDSDEKIYFKYLYYKETDLEEAYNYLLNIAYPYAILKSLYNKGRFFLNDLVNSIFRGNKYKKFLDMYIELDNVYENLLRM